MQETKHILDYQTPISADDYFDQPKPRVPVFLTLRRVAFVASFIFLFAGIWHVMNHLVDGRTELIYGGLLAAFANPFRRRGKN